MTTVSTNVGRNMEYRMKAAFVVYTLEPIDSKRLPRNALTQLHRSGNIRCCKCGVQATHTAIYRHKNEGTDVRHHDYLCATQTPGVLQLMTKDHILPKSFGGGDRLSNLRAMCVSCNNKRSNFVGNKELVSMVVNLRPHMSNSAARKRGVVRNATHHPLRQWLTLFNQFPELENRVRFA